MNQRRAFARTDRVARLVMQATAFVTVGLLLGIFLFLLVSGIGAFRQIPIGDFLLGTDWNPTAFGAPQWGIGSLIVGSLAVTFVALLVAVPMGLAIAIFLRELATPRQRELIKPAIEMIATVPSVTLGLVGLLFVAPLVAQLTHRTSGLGALTAGLLVGIAALPTIASIAEDALSSVNDRLRAASLALGATRWETIQRVVLPAARSGLIAAVMLGLGRIIGETMIVLMVAGNSRALPASLLDPVRPLTATVAIDIKEAVVNSLHWESLFAIGLALFAITFVVNLVADALIHTRSPR